MSASWKVFWFVDPRSEVDGGSRLCRLTSPFVSKEKRTPFFDVGVDAFLVAGGALVEVGVLVGVDALLPFLVGVGDLDVGTLCGDGALGIFATLVGVGGSFVCVLLGTVSGAVLRLEDGSKPGNRSMVTDVE